MTSESERDDLSNSILTGAQRLLDAGVWTEEHNRRCEALHVARRAASARATAAWNVAASRPHDQKAVGRFVDAFQTHLRLVADMLELCGRDEQAAGYRRVAGLPVTGSVDCWLADSKISLRLINALGG